MTSAAPRFFGSKAQRRMQRTAHMLWPLLVADPAYGTEGRMIGIDGPSDTDIPKLAALARLQGASVNHYLPKQDEARFDALYEAEGLRTDRWDQYMGAESCLAASAELLETFRLPARYSLHRVTDATPNATLDSLEETATACGVLPPMSPVLFGQMRDTVYFYLAAEDGRVAACSGSAMRNHPDSRFPRCAWWGMLATAPEDRGQGLSHYLGAQAALYMNARFGAREFYTGVRSDNLVSAHVCARLGVTDSRFACKAILDPEAFSEGGYTR